MLSIPDAAYNSDWYNGPIKVARKLIVISAVAQREVSLEAAGITTIGIALLNNVI